MAENIRSVFSLFVKELSPLYEDSRELENIAILSIEAILGKFSRMDLLMRRDEEIDEKKHY